MGMSDMDLRHLRYFVAVAEEQHITRAAEKLGIQQPPRRQLIGAMERELDVQLLRRRPRGVELTDAGRALFDAARDILARVDLALATVRRTARGEQGRIVIGFTRSTPYHPFVPRVIRIFRETYPLVSVGIEEGNGVELREALLQQKIDVAFLRSDREAPHELVLERVLEEPMVVALPAGHHLARTPRGRHGKALTLSALADEKFVVYRQEYWPGLYERIVAGCQAAGFIPIVGQHTPRIGSVLNFVSAGFGVAIVPASLEGLHAEGLSFRPIRGSPQITAPINLVTRRGEASATVRRFIELVRRTAK